MLCTRSHVETETGIERERLERLVGNGPPCAPVILIKTLIPRHKGRAWRGWREAGRRVRPLSCTTSGRKQRARLESLVVSKRIVLRACYPGGLMVGRYSS